MAKKTPDPKLDETTGTFTVPGIKIPKRAMKMLGWATAVATALTIVVGGGLTLWNTKIEPLIDKARSARYAEIQAEEFIRHYGETPSLEEIHTEDGETLTVRHFKLPPDSDGCWSSTKEKIGNPFRSTMFHKLIDGTPPAPPSLAELAPDVARLVYAGLFPQKVNLAQGWPQCVRGAARAFCVPSPQAHGNDFGIQVIYRNGEWQDELWTWRDGCSFRVQRHWPTGQYQYVDWHCCYDHRR